MGDLIIFQLNALSSLAYLLSHNLAVIFLTAGVLGCIILSVRETVELSVRDEQNII